MTLSPEDPVTAVEGVGSTYAGRLARTFGIRTVRDLVEHYPRRYEDPGEVTELSAAQAGQRATLVGTVLAWTHKQPRPSLRIAEARVAAEDGGIFTVTYFNQPWRARQLEAGTVAAFSGEVGTFRGDVQLTMPDHQVLPDRDTSDLEDRALQPLYPAAEDLPAWRLARWVERALEGLPTLADHLPGELRQREGLVTLDEAVRGIHHPADHDVAEDSRRRLVFDELLMLQLGLQARRARLEANLAGRDNTPTTGGLADAFVDGLPFELTGAQRRALDELTDDLSSERPMHRLLQGDVGSGKTVVAVWAMLCAVDAGRQAAMMAPTSVLAEQHHRTLTELLAPLGVNVLDGVRVELLTASTGRSERRRILGELLSGRTDLLVGTHALLEEGVRFADLGLVVVDEQHRFGVSQRVDLRDKGREGAGREGADRGDGAAADAGGEGGANLPDVLVMTATPIPRSLALTLYGDLDVTLLDELPPGREPVRTELITPAERARRDKLYDFVRREAERGRQTFVVCPLVEESEELAARAAVAEHRHLAEEVWPDLSVGLVHGQLSAGDKERAMAGFRDGDTDVLVATTVIEVGVDVPDATVMVIEDAERFGISQLHQLRGRVGRGGHASYCVLFAGWNEPLTDDARDRLTAVAGTTDGFELAETDLRMRGQGQLFGERQSGLPDLKLARLHRDQGLVEATRERARAILAADPELGAADHRSLREELFRRYEGGLDEFAALHTG